MTTVKGIWAVTADPRLTDRARDLIANSEAAFVSTVSIWEVAIKHALDRKGPNRMPMSGLEAIAEFKAAEFEFLSVTAEHAAVIADLPLLHGDPFDRLLAAQAHAEPLRLVTHDDRLARFSDATLLV